MATRKERRDALKRELGGGSRLDGKSIKQLEAMLDAGKHLVKKATRGRDYPAAKTATTMGAWLKRKRARAQDTHWSATGYAHGDPIHFDIYEDDGSKKYEVSWSTGDDYGHGDLGIWPSLAKAKSMAKRFLQTA